MRPALIVMYHYILPDGRPFPGGIRPMMASEFEKQLDWLADRYCIVDPERFMDWLKKGVEPAKPPCLLTFDDGTRDHAEVVTPILVRRGLKGLFFLLSGPTEEGLMPLTHAVHWILGQDEENVWRLFQRYAEDKLAGLSALGDPNEARRIYHYEPELRARIKYAANMALPPAATADILRNAVEQAGMTLKDLARQWFVSAEQIQYMRRAGMTLGLHGHSHTSLQILGAEGIRREISRSADYFQNLVQERLVWWSCPFGGTRAKEDALAAMNQAMISAGLTAAVTTQQAPIHPNVNPLALPRYDCIYLPPRKQAPPELELPA